MIGLCLNPQFSMNKKPSAVVLLCDWTKDHRRDNLTCFVMSHIPVNITTLFSFFLTYVDAAPVDPVLIPTDDRGRPRIPE